MTSELASSIFLKTTVIKEHYGKDQQTAEQSVRGSKMFVLVSSIFTFSKTIVS